jgi:hypothetical protein
MSLIPSESYSFPDHFTTTVVPSRRPKKEERQAPADVRKAPLIVPLPNPAPQSAAKLQRNGSDVAVAPPNPALIRATAPPTRIPTPNVPKHAPAPILKNKPAAAARVPAMDPPPPVGSLVALVSTPPASNVIQMMPARATPEPVRKVQPAPAPIRPRPTPIVTTSQADFFELFAQNADETLAKRRRRMKFRRFIALESAAVAILLPLATVGVLYQPSNAALHWILNIFTIASAITAALIPILFYALTPTLPEIER